MSHSMPFSLDLTLGPMLIGVLVNLVLLGFQVVMTHIYFQTQRDPKWLQCMVGFIFVLDLINSGLDAAFAYRYLVTLFGDFEAINVTSWLFTAEPIMTGIMATMVQSFFGWRLSRLTGFRWIGYAISGVSLVSCGCSIAYAVKTESTVYFDNFKSLQAIVIVWLGLSAVTDITISIGLVWWLRQNKTGYAATDNVITKIIRMTVQTGLLTSLFAVLDIATFIATASNIHFFFQLPLIKIHSCSMLSSLNARSTWAASSLDHQVTGATSIRVVTTATVHRDDDVELDMRRNLSIYSSTKSPNHSPNHRQTTFDVSRRLSESSEYVDRKYDLEQGVTSQDGILRLDRVAIDADLDTADDESIGTEQHRERSKQMAMLWDKQPARAA